MFLNQEMGEKGENDMKLRCFRAGSFRVFSSLLDKIISTKLKRTFTFFRCRQWITVGRYILTVTLGRNQRFSYHTLTISVVYPKDVQRSVGER